MLQTSHVTVELKKGQQIRMKARPVCWPCILMRKRPSSLLLHEFESRSNKRPHIHGLMNINEEMFQI